MAIILRPKHIAGLWAGLPNASRTAAAYRARQRAHLATNPAAVEPYVVATPVEAFIGCGVWRVPCRCNEAPHTDPEWGLSCCFGCGAIYETVVFPANWPAIETLLAMRPVMATRNWQAPETYEDLVAEQIAHGDPV